MCDFFHNTTKICILAFIPEWQTQTHIFNSTYREECFALSFQHVCTVHPNKHMQLNFDCSLISCIYYVQFLCLQTAQSVPVHVAHPHSHRIRQHNYPTCSTV